jgi:hypothetical protein
MISGRSPENYAFQADAFGTGLSGFKIYDPSGAPAGAMVIKVTDCSLVLFDNLWIT